MGQCGTRHEIDPEYGQSQSHCDEGYEERLNFHDIKYTMHHQRGYTHAQRGKNYLQQVKLRLCVHFCAASFSAFHFSIAAVRRSGRLPLML